MNPIRVFSLLDDITEFFSVQEIIYFEEVYLMFEYDYCFSIKETSF